MAFPWVPTQYGPQGRQLAWLNTVFTSHGIFCGCDSAYTHFITACNNNNYIQTKQKKEIETSSNMPYLPTLLDSKENQGTNYYTRRYNYRRRLPWRRRSN